MSLNEALHLIELYDLCVIRSTGKSRIWVISHADADIDASGSTLEEATMKFMEKALSAFFLLREVMQKGPM